MRVGVCLDGGHDFLVVGVRGPLPSRCPEHVRLWWNLSRREARLQKKQVSV